MMILANADVYVLSTEPSEHDSQLGFGNVNYMKVH